MSELALVIARLADAAERLLAEQKRRDREERAMRLEAQWPSLPPLRRQGLGVFLTAIPGLAAKFDRIVPPDFVAQTGSDEVTVACPCGSDPQIRPGRLASCPGECGRWFLLAGRTVHVALSPLNTPEVEAAPPDEADDQALSAGNRTI